MDNHSGTASWAQALFSVVAIYFAGRQGAIAFRRQQKAEKLKTLEALLAIVAHADSHFQGLSNPMRGMIRAVAFSFGFPRSDREDEFTLINEALSAIPVNEMPSYSVIKSVMQVRKALAEAHHLIGNCHDGGSAIPHQTRLQLEPLHAVIRQAHEVIAAAINNVHADSLLHSGYFRQLWKIVPFWGPRN